MAGSTARGIASLVLLSLLLVAGGARAQDETFDSIAGAWWFKLAGKDAGALLMAFSEPAAAAFLVEDIAVTGNPSFGFSRGLASFFVIDAGQELNFDSKGNVIGTLDLDDPDGGGLVGTLVLEKGKPNKAFTRLKLRATIQSDGGEPLRVKLDGRRVPANFPVLTGKAPDGKLGGKGVKSRVFELGISGSAELGLPAYTFVGSGPAEIDGVEVPDVTMDGTVVLSPDKRVHGLLEDSSDFGTGALSGSLHLPGESVVPKLKLKAQAERKVTATGNLDEPVEPVLSVTPATFNFGAIRLDAAPLTQVFDVSNVGVGLLSGEATRQSGSSDFTILAPSTYGPLDPNDPPEQITVQFDPNVAGAKTAQLFFSVAGAAGSRVVTVTGTGGVPVLDVEPPVQAYGNVVVLQSLVRTFSITNEGDGPLEGTATITTGTTDFTLLLPDGTTPVEAIPYTIAPAANLLIRVRFTPTTAAQKTGTLTLTGGGGAQVALTGTGTAN
jgi:hypothetical protein